MKRLRKKSIESISFQFDLDLVMYVIPFTKRFEGNNWQKRPGTSIGFFERELASLVALQVVSSKEEGEGEENFLTSFNKPRLET